ncbi:hypothetical protein Curi_c16400 [Gottschalkia acidurici 9a]|uniref:Uncharacterized protein n=1 Tax=Gottschalkia acidurici (strain ATCC 7906 / DSM 604 / BCRC 14475 / CIP 104303 / KCTC 5404 / NCIMB 10678 / 9a) TaxID=1128398 RepID=K0AXW7_GOTA9|nr:hypothetical protein Curi_c16400 [Gottschalkia acidurici 9a]
MLVGIKNKFNDTNIEKYKATFMLKKQYTTCLNKLYNLVKLTKFIETLLHIKIIR